VTPDVLSPATAKIISNGCGITKAFSYDMNAACSSFLFALTTGAQFIQGGLYKKVVIVGADKMSAIVDYTDRSNCIIFGDGAAAVMLEPNLEGYGILANREHFIYQEGATVFKFAVKNMADVAAQVMTRQHLSHDDIAWLVPHQANKRIIDATANRMGVGPEKVMLNIQRYGNTTSATIPLCLWDFEKQLHKGDNLILAAFGGGFTWGAMHVKWAYNS
jgi:3-oxoacyl-[acyl-carrier-protein] synthase-3